MSSPAGRPSALSYIVGNTIVLAVGILAAYAALVVGHAASADSLDPRTVDFLVYFSAGRIALSGHAADMYLWGPMLHQEQLIAFPYAVPVHTIRPSLIYPPFTALLFAPFAALPYDLARLIWFVLSAAGLASALFTLSRLASFTARGDLLLRLTTFISVPVLQTLREGEVTVFLLLALVGAYLYATRRNSLLAGICLAAFTVKPQYAVPIVLVLIVRRHYAILASFLAWAVLFFAVPAIVFGPGTVIGYFQNLLNLQHGGPEYNTASESIYGLTHELFPDRIAVATWAIASLAIIAFLLWYARRSTSLQVPFALSVVVALLISPHLLLHELLLLLLPVAVAIREAHRHEKKIGWPLAGVYAAVLATVPLQLVIPVRISTFAILAVGLLLVYVHWPPSRITESAETPSRPALSDTGVRVTTNDRTQIPEFGSAQEIGSSGEGGGA